MCNAFSGVINRAGKVYWKSGIDSHSDIIENFNLDDTRKDGGLCPFEIVPGNGDYLNPDKWSFNFDMQVPDWWKKSHESACWHAFKKWEKEVYSKINLEEARNPINPFKIDAPKKITKEHIKLLFSWDSVGDSVWTSVWDSVRASVGASVGDSVRDSVWDSVRASVGASVRDSVWDSVRASVWDSVWDSVWAYVGSLLNLKRSEWEYTDKIKTKKYPFQPLVDLWKQGLVPSFDGKTWRLHAGQNAEVVFEITKENLQSMGCRD